MKLKELTAGQRFLLCRTGQEYKVRVDQRGVNKGFVACTRRLSASTGARIEINENCLVELINSEKN